MKASSLSPLPYPGSAGRSGHIKELVRGIPRDM